MASHTKHHTYTQTKADETTSYEGEIEQLSRGPALLLAHTPEVASSYRFPFEVSVTVGRKPAADLIMHDKHVSSLHFRIFKSEERFLLEDLGSKNLTYLNGAEATGSNELKNGDVIRAGRCVFVFYKASGRLLEAPDKGAEELVGPFHAPLMVRDLSQALKAESHILLAGPSGSGKELQARAAARLRGKELVAHNCARFTTEEEAASTLFGVDARPGVIEQAADGVAFLDEIHNLPERIQKSLLRILEDGKFARIGETEYRDVDVLFICATNAPGPDFGVTHDLKARLHRVDVPALSERRADIPAIFKYALRQALSRHEIDAAAVIDEIHGKLLEKICLYAFPDDNVRGMIDLAERIGSRISSGSEPRSAVQEIFEERIDPFFDSTNSSLADTTEIHGRKAFEAEHNSD